MRRNALGALLLGITLVAVPDTAAASLTTYAREVKNYLQLQQEPGCTLCHQDDDGGDDTVTRPFGESVRAFGAIGDEDVGSLTYALGEMEYYEVDSDGDTVPDMDELRQGTDPNDGMDPPPPPPPTGEGGDDGTDDDGSSTNTVSGSGGTSALDTSGAGGTQSDRPRPPTRRGIEPEMKTGCAVAAANGGADAGTLLILLGLAGIARGRATARRGRRGACSTPRRNDWRAGRRSRRSRGTK